MKEIPNKQFNEKETVASMLLECLNSPPQQGFDFASIRARNRVDDALKDIKPGDTIKLEDREYETAQQAIKDTRWIRRTAQIIEFAELFGL